MSVYGGDSWGREAQHQKKRKMSVYGGDSWGREAQHRKRRIDEVVLDRIDIDDSSYNKLSSGKYACLVCPNNPIFDTPLMLRMHCKGSRHSAAKSKAKEKELKIRDEINKRLALPGSHTASSVNSSTTKHNAHLAGKPLIQMAQKAASEILGNKRLNQTSRNENRDMVHRPNDVKNVILGNQRLEHNLRTENRDMVHRPNDVKNVTPDISQNHSYCSNETSDKLVQNHLDFRERNERELKFTSAGWKRDCHGKWYKDENVEFDSDEEDPNSSF